MRIDDEGVWISRSFDEPLSLEVGGRRVWAFVAARYGRPDASGELLVPWPEMLRPYLNGRADVIVRSLRSDEVLLEDSVTLGDGDGTVRLVDGQGRPLSVTKSRRGSAAMFADASTADRQLLVDTVVQALDLMQSHGYDAFLAFGNLLGAIREGRLIGHDDDADISYLSQATHPVDVMLESFRIERAFLDAGWRTLRLSGGTFKLQVELSGGLRTAIDVFSAFYFDGLLHMMPGVVADLPREALLPTSTVILEGREVAAP